MNLHNEPSEGNGGAEPDEPSETPRYAKPSKITPKVFFEGIQVDCTDGVQCGVFAGRDGQPNDHAWTPDGVEYAVWIAGKVAGRQPGYFSLAAFRRGSGSR